MNINVLQKILLAIFLGINLFAVQAQPVFFIQGGYDLLYGVGAVGIHYEHMQGSIGFFPVKLPGSGDFVTGFCWVATYETAKHYSKDAAYISIGQNTIGYKTVVETGRNVWDVDLIAPMWLSMIGYRLNLITNRKGGMFLKAGVGYAWGEFDASITQSVSVGYYFQ